MTRRRQYVCVHSECKNPKPNKMNNIERHVWTQHVRKDLGKEDVSYSAKEYKQYVENYVLPLDYFTSDKRGNKTTVNNNNSTTKYEEMIEWDKHSDSESTVDSAGEDSPDQMDSPRWATKDDATALLGLAAIAKAAETIEDVKSPGTYRRKDFYENEAAHIRLAKMASYACDEEMGEVENELNSSSNSYEFTRLHASKTTKKRKSEEMDTEEAADIQKNVSESTLSKVPKSFKTGLFDSAMSAFRQPMKEVQYHSSPDRKFDFSDAHSVFVNQDDRRRSSSHWRPW
eukprot:Nk52_evm9s1129 gene=Nk52_evmTU9s1129